MPLSEIELHLGDCLEILPTLEANSVDAVITDIPYGTTDCKWDEVIPLDEMWEQVKRVTDVFITTASQPFTSRLVISNLDWFKYEWIWNKVVPSNFQLSNYQPLKSHENILAFSSLPAVFVKHGNTMPYYPIMTETNPDKIRPKKNGRVTQNVMRIRSGEHIHKTPEGISYPKTLITINRYKNECNPLNKSHPTQKPVELYEYLIKTYTNEGDTVLDIAMGSGTTGVACVQTGRNFIGIEIEPKYYDIAEKRIAEAQLQMRMPI